MPELAREQGLAAGFKTGINTGKLGGQEVYHLHVHVLVTRFKSASPRAACNRSINMGSFQHLALAYRAGGGRADFWHQKLRNIGQDLGGAVKGFKDGMKAKKTRANPADSGRVIDVNTDHSKK